MIEDCESLSEAKYLMQHLYSLCINQGVTAAQNQSQMKELQVKLNQLQIETRTHQKLLEQVLGNDLEAYGISGLKNFFVLTSKEIRSVVRCQWLDQNSNSFPSLRA